jgi:hypothetical protein
MKLVCKGINGPARRLASLGIIGACMFGALLVFGQQPQQSSSEFIESEAGVKAGVYQGACASVRTFGVSSLGGKYTKTVTITGHIKGGCVGKVLVKFDGGDTLYGTIKITELNGKTKRCLVTTVYTGGTGLLSGVKGVGYGTYEVTNEMKTLNLEHEVNPITVTGSFGGHVTFPGPATE